LWCIVNNITNRIDYYHRDVVSATVAFSKRNKRVSNDLWLTLLSSERRNVGGWHFIN
jgi:hypothetical protein